MFTWLENIEKKRWWMIFVIVGFIFSVLFGTGSISVINSEAGFIISVAVLVFGIAESANHKKVSIYKSGKVSYFDPYFDKEYFWDEIQNSPPVKIKTGESYIRKPIFIGIVLDIVSAVLFVVGVIKLF